MNDEQKRNIIMIADDSPESLTILRKVLGGKYIVRPAISGKAALKAVSVGPLPDLILLDVMMPEMDGFQVCEQLKSDPILREIPVIFITAKDQVADETRGFEAGAVDYISKPFSIPIVLARVATHLAMHAAHVQLKQQYIALQEMDKLRKDVDAISRHDMKSPLNGVIGFSDLLLDGGDLSTDQEKYARLIRKSGVTALHMLNLSLGLYRMEQGVYQLSPVNIDLIPIIQNVRNDSGAWLTGNRLTLAITLQGRPTLATDSFFVLGEEVLCYSVLANLIKNAMEASPEGGTVTIDLQESGGMGVAKIHNQGAVPKEIRERFFEKYATAGKISGTGLGTYSAKLIAEAMGGIIRMNSSEADGTTITVTIPMGERPIHAHEPPWTVISDAEKGELVAGKQQTDEQTVILDAVKAEPKTLSELVSMFLEEAPRRMENLKAALESQINERALEETMWLRAASSDVGATRVSSQSLRLQGTIEMDDWNDAYGVYRRLEQNLHEAILTLREQNGD